MPESGTYGSVRGALSNERPYRDKKGLAPMLDRMAGAELRNEAKCGRAVAAGAFVPGTLEPPLDTKSAGRPGSMSRNGLGYFFAGWGRGSCGERQ